MICPRCKGAGRFNRGTPDEYICGRCGGAGAVPDSQGTGEQKPGCLQVLLLVLTIVAAILAAALGFLAT